MRRARCPFTPECRCNNTTCANRREADERRVLAESARWARERREYQEKNA